MTNRDIPEGTVTVLVMQRSATDALRVVSAPLYTSDVRIVVY